MVRPSALVRRSTKRFWIGVPFFILASVALCWAHERFVSHHLKWPLPPEFYHFFLRKPDQFLGMDSNLLKVGLAVSVVLFFSLVLWMFRQVLELGFIRRMHWAGGVIQDIMQDVLAFLTDRPVRRKWFSNFSEWAVIFFLRSPALVLMYSASNDSLVMPSYPLEPSSAYIFKYLQVALALLIITQTFLPLCGAIIFGTWLYLFKWGPTIAIDAMPVLTVAVVYATSPWMSHRVAITRLNETQVRWVRITLGAGFFFLGWLKIINHNLVVGVAQNYPSITNDPALKAFTLLAGPAGSSHFASIYDLPIHPYELAIWLVSFALAEVICGFMVATGVFTRVWGFFMVAVFTKLMLVDFGWSEIPHIYPIAALMAIVFSNNLTGEFQKIEDLEEAAAREGKKAKQMAIITGTSAAVALLVIIFPLWASTHYSRVKWKFAPPIQQQYQGTQAHEIQQHLTDSSHGDSMVGCVHHH